MVNYLESLDLDPKPKHESGNADDPNEEVRKQLQAIPVPAKTAFDTDERKKADYLRSYRDGYFWSKGNHLWCPTNPSAENLHAIRGWIEGWQAGVKAGGTADLPSKYAPYLKWSEPDGFKPIFNGRNLDGWTPGKDAWTVVDGVLRCTGSTDLTWERSFGSCELTFEWKRPAGSNGEYTYEFPGVSTTARAKPGEWQRESMKRHGTAKRPIVFKALEGVEIRNVLLRELEKWT